MVLRILFRPKAKKYPQNTFRVHNRLTSVLCTLMIALFSFLCVLDKFLQPTAAAEQFDIEHQFIPGSDLQLLIDAAVVLLYGMNADESQIRDVRSFVTVNVMLQNPPLSRRKCPDLPCKRTKHIFHSGRQLTDRCSLRLMER